MGHETPDFHGVGAHTLTDAVLTFSVLFAAGGLLWFAIHAIGHWIASPRNIRAVLRTVEAFKRARSEFFNQRQSP